MNIILIGHRGSGKTSVGAELAARLACPLYDSDAIVEGEAGCSIAQLVETGGWDLFRRKEKEAIGKMTGLKNSVIATGGGAVMDPESAALLRRLGVVVWLMADVETIMSRLRKDHAADPSRPSLNGGDPFAETALILTKRLPVYQEMAHYSVDTANKSVQEVADAIECQLLSHEKKAGAVNVR